MHVFMQMGVYITLFAYVYIYMCGSVYDNACNIWMMLACRCIDACTYKYMSRIVKN